MVFDTKRWYSKQRDGIWNKEVVFETKRWFLKQRDGIETKGGYWNKGMVFETKRWYSTQRDGIWNKEVGGLQKTPPLEDSLEIIDIGEEVLEKSEAVSAACVCSQLVVSDRV